ncbi:MAG: amidohydrolase [Spirochaetaceae bacterium]|jgi:amidohydrolase|nr:amidohydrolase [Spirochaetaceae bacterium]
MDTQKILDLVEKYYPLGAELRHTIHRYPEPAFEEVKTAKLIADTLTSRGIPVQTGVAKTGVIGLISGGKPGKTVLLRADMDAVEVEEKADVPYKSERKGLMHACGHDGHTAGLLMAALVLNDLKDRLAGNVKLMFQPGEETTGGAEPMIQAGVLENPNVDAAFGCHLWGSVKAGEIQTKAGSLMASPDEFSLRVIGKGGHAALPHLTADPVVMSAQIICALQELVSRRNNPLRPLVISACSIHGGAVHNVIPDFVDIIGTIRTLDRETRNLAPQWMEETAAGIARVWGGNCRFQTIKRYPPLINDENAAALVIEAAKKIAGHDRVKQAEPNMGGEDFAYLAEKVPAAFFFVGIAENEPVVHHNAYFAWKDEILKTSSAVLCRTAADYLNQGFLSS